MGGCKSIVYRIFWGRYAQSSHGQLVVDLLCIVRDEK
jgi:hypothetical protein